MRINQDNDYKKLFQITKQNRKKRNSAITRILLDKKSIWPRFWWFTFFDTGDIFSKITEQNRKKRNSAITRVLLDKKSIWPRF